jgi:hypothetical protein
MPLAIVSAAAGLVFFAHLGAAGAQAVLATGDDAGITDDGLHRVSPLVMEAAWVVEDFDLSGYSRLLLMPTAIQFRPVREGSTDARSRALADEFALSEDRKEWLAELWKNSVEEQFKRDRVDASYTGDVSEVLVVQGFLVDFVSRVPPSAPGSVYTLVNDPWSATIVVELRDAATAQLLARTVDRRNAKGLLEVGAVWHQTEDLMQRWADVMADRVDELSDLGGRPRWRPDWALEGRYPRRTDEELPGEAP